MSTKVKFLIVAVTVMVFALIAAGCGALPTAAPNGNATPANTSNMPKEDPDLFIKDMNQTIATIVEQTKMNRLEDAKKASSELVSLNEKLVVHVTDLQLKEELRQGVLALQSEVQKPGASQSAIEKNVQTVKNLLNTASDKLRNHTH